MLVLKFLICYQKFDLLLCDMFEKFINVCLKDYGLDPVII